MAQVKKGANKEIGEEKDGSAGSVDSRSAVALEHSVGVTKKIQRGLDLQREKEEFLYFSIQSKKSKTRVHKGIRTTEIHTASGEKSSVRSTQNPPFAWLFRRL